MSNRLPAALAVGVLGSAVALATFQLTGGSGHLQHTSTKGGPGRSRRKSRQSFEAIEPGGLRWMEASNDYVGADEMPRALQNSRKDEMVWESLPVYMHPDDAFAQHENFVEALVSSERCSFEDLEQIMRDIPRTFPDDEYFRDTDVQDTMRRVLTAICVEYPDIGYVQSMNFLVAFLFLNAKTEDACFALFRRLMSHPRMRMDLMYKPGLPLLIKVLNALKELTKKHVTQCHAKFVEVGLEYISMLNWFMTLFTYSMDWVTVGPIWDMFFERGWEGPLRAALMLIRDNSSKILQGDFDSISVVIREACENAPADICARSKEILLDHRDLEIIASITRE